MSRRSENDPDIHDSAIQADEALAEAIKLPYGPARTTALKKAGELRVAVDKRGIRFAKRGRPPKTTSWERGRAPADYSGERLIWGRDLVWGRDLAVNKVNWSQVGRVSVPGRYMFKFGWLTITEQELAVWRRFPSASFTLYRPSSAETEDDFRLGAFDLPEDSSSDGR